ncbi:LOW QUALITY PROTEIN: calmodulin-regulated spectrin-associated protein 1-B-like [Denticeps clupeoides]|uniref:LOW QUALITY PROTEIN: calmodulin-regulated spectrin-associated protein 1-B-like n=1 Tax=Denticeps clupeoides TaxID=299321 RepID=UPI0010A591C7|nr:LOW QUALITY PROTEIN: calmodulin-regulated spectrin-associated protein 1-B-like [Denticeps clupeoides]
MDAEPGAAEDSTRRKMETAGEVAEVAPLEMYDSARAKIAANLRWLFAKAYGIDHIPEDLRDPFYTDQYEQEHIKPPVLRLLLSCELYCRVCGLILKGDQVASLHSHKSVIQALSRKGIYVMESDDVQITESDLTCVPIKMSAHMSMIDALMMAYTVEMISIEKVVACVKRFSTFNASKELPFDLEDAMVFWINKVNMKIREITEKEVKGKQHLLESPSHQKCHSKWYWKLVPVRYRRDHASGRQMPFFPVLEDLMRDVCDGAALLAVVHYYCPDLMKLEDICLKEVTSIADSLYNIQLLMEFVNEYLNRGLYLTLEDMLYAPLVLKHNVMVFIAELFWWFEVVKPEFVQPRDVQDFKDARAVVQPKSARPSVPISNATKRSFLVTPGVVDSAPPVQNCSEVCNSNKGSTSFSPAHPLLPLRQRQQKPQQGEDILGYRNRSNSLTQDSHARGSSVGWPEKRQRPLSQLNRYVLHSATDSDIDVASGDSASLTCSISEDSLASSVTPKHQSHQSGPRRINGCGLLGNVNMDEEDERLMSVVSSENTILANVEEERWNGTPGSKTSSRRRQEEISSDARAASFYLEPLMPAVLKPAKEKSVNLNKEEESGETYQRSSSWRSGAGGGEGPGSSAKRRPAHSMNRTFTPNSSAESNAQTLEAKVSPSVTAPQAHIQVFKTQTASSADLSPVEPDGFYLHSSTQDKDKPEQAWDTQSDSDTLDFTDEQDLELIKEDLHLDKEQMYEDDQESAKLREDMSVKEHEDKDGGEGGSLCSSPGLSSVHSAVSSTSVRMTSFAERKMQHSRFGSNQDIRSSANSSQRTTPDGSENSCSFPLLTSWRTKRDKSPTPQGRDSANVLASELQLLHMQLEEKRRAIEMQKRKMEVLSARQRQKLGKVAFLHIVKKGKSDTLPQPVKSEYYLKDGEKFNSDREGASKDDTCADAVRASVKHGMGGPEEKSGGGSVVSSLVDEKVLLLDEELDMNECNRSIELLNEAINSIQQQMMQLSVQQDLLMKQNLQSPSSSGPQQHPVDQEEAASERTVRPAVHFEAMSTSSGTPLKKPPKLSSSRGSRSKPSDLKLANDHVKLGGRLGTSSQRMASPGSRTPRAEPEETVGLERGTLESRTTFQLHDEANMRQAASWDGSIDPFGVTFDESPSSALQIPEVSQVDPAGKNDITFEDDLRTKANLIEVDLSDVAAQSDEGSCSMLDITTEAGDGEKKAGMGFFFKDEQKAEDELAKKRAAFLLKQQKKAEEARLRKQQLEAESEQKRDETRRKAEEERIRKDEEKARRELIKQEYLRRKQQEMFEEQGQAKPKPKAKKQRPKSVFRDESSSNTFSKCSPAKDNLSSAQSGSSLSLASVATTGADSVNSGGASSQRGESVESFPGLSRNSSRTTERDWDNGSTASSITSTSMAEYTGPKLFKEPSAKSNKPIIHNAISHCCLAGKVNEAQKNSILEELEKCESNHLMILFRDGGCQFRALYSYFPDTEEIQKLTGTGPKNISKKMIDKLYKYSSDRKQFTVIPAKTVSVSVDALTIHNHLWQVKRPAGPKKNMSGK